MCAYVFLHPYTHTSIYTSVCARILHVCDGFAFKSVSMYVCICIYDILNAIL